MTLLRNTIQDKLTGDTVTFALPADRGDLIALAYRSGEVIENEVSEDGESLRLTVQVSRQAYELHGYKLQPYIE